ncbi:zinc metalloproteinase nas-4-like isoform X2 [Homarus americanus]|uniref:zinc metalloproteinase nas-4-like isoform X2 n=1 Tax=Homarus americanus TaxID=6706 RepID=UPI001C440DAC|nr:zinc metalloproteinase nas-4-like isoform X2 [Homarus americanus]
MLRWYCLTWVMVVGSKDITALIRSSDPNVQILGQPQLDPNFLPEVAMGNPDTIANDIPGPSLSPADFENSAQMVHAAVDTSHQADPIELAGLYQGDIILNSMDEYSLSDMSFMGRGRSAFPNPRNAIIKMTRRWPNGVIPYVISSSYNSHERGTIAMAIKKYHDTTCIRLVPRTIERDYIHILKGDGCSSSVGRIGGAQVVSLGPGCLYVGIVMHELMHAAGFWHEQSRADRDNFITVNKMNVQSGMWYNFEKYPWERIQSLGVEYDLGSVMHYGPYAFARDRTRPTIIPRKTGVEIGQRRGFSEKDIQKLQKLYNCANNATETVVTTGAPLTTLAPDICEDNNDHCNAWVDLGECEKNPIWMNVNCRKACKQCVVTETCEDKHKYCLAWSESGQCRTNPNYMLLYCKQACKQCVNNFEVV